MPGVAYGSPRDRQYRRSLEAWQQSWGNPARLAGQDRMYGEPGQVPEYDWQTALPPRGRTAERRLLAVLAESKGNQLLTVLRGQDAIYGAPGQVPEYDWQTARPELGRRRHQAQAAAQAEQRSSGVTGTLLGQDQVYGDPGQVPVYDWRRSPPRPMPPKEMIPPSLLVTLLQALAGPPEGKTSFPDFPVPRPTTKAHTSLRAQAAVWTDRLLDLLAGQDAIYGEPGQVPEYDWQTALPPRGRALPLGNRTHVASLVSSTLQGGQDTFYGAPGQVPTHVLPLPPRGRRVPRPLPQDPLNTLSTVLFVGTPATLQQITDATALLSAAADAPRSALFSTADQSAGPAVFQVREGS